MILKKQEDAQGNRIRWLVEQNFEKRKSTLNFFLSLASVTLLLYCKFFDAFQWSNPIYCFFYIVWKNIYIFEKISGMTKMVTFHWERKYPDFQCPTVISWRRAFVFSQRWFINQKECQTVSDTTWQLLCMERSWQEYKNVYEG